MFEVDLTAELVLFFFQSRTSSVQWQERSLSKQQRLKGWITLGDRMERDETSVEDAVEDLIHRTVDLVLAMSRIVGGNLHQITQD